MVVTFAAVGYVRQVLEAEPPPEGLPGFPEFDESPPQAAARVPMISSAEARRSRYLAMLNLIKKDAV
jgi:hypothetical protein